MKKNKYYELFTEEDISDYHLRIALNCFNATLVQCDEKMSNKCKSMNPEMWHKCPKQTGTNMGRRS